MAHVRIQRSGEAWHERGTSMKMAGQNRYRITITELDDAWYRDAAAEELEVRVNGLRARSLRWVVPPAESAPRGYVTFEASLDLDDEG